jgi:hypothetical protein
LLITKGDVYSSHVVMDNREKYYHVNKRMIKRARHDLNITQISTSVYSQLLHPFANVLIFFSKDIGSLR